MPASGTVAPRVAHHRFERFALVLAMALATTGLWTGSPLLAVWIGSRVQHSAGELSMGAVVVAVVALAVQSYLLVRLIARLDRTYRAVVGVPPVRRQLPWMRSMRGERTHVRPAAPRLSPLEVVLVVSVVVAVLAFEVWFLFFAGSPLPAA